MSCKPMKMLGSGQVSNMYGSGQVSGIKYVSLSDVLFKNSKKAVKMKKRR